MRRCVRAARGVARCRRALLGCLVVALVGGLAGAPFALGGCGYALALIPLLSSTSHNGGSGTTTSSGDAVLIVPLTEPLVGAAIAPSDHMLSLPSVSIDGNPIPVTTAVPATWTAALQSEAIAHGIFNPATQILWPVRTVGPVYIVNGSDISVSIQANTSQGPAKSPQIGFIGAPLSSFGTSPLPLVQLAANPAAFQPGGSPDIKPQGASAWKTLNPVGLHSDGPFALPGEPNPDGLQVLDPPQIVSNGPSWANPNPGCVLISAHGSYTAPPPHADPQPTGCGHGTLVYLPQVTSSLVDPPAGTLVRAGDSVTFTAIPTTTGLGVDRVEFYLADALVAGASAPPWSSVVTPQGVTLSADVSAYAVAFDHDGAQRSSTAISLTLVAPLELTLPTPLPAIVVGGQAVTWTVNVSGGLEPFVVDLEADSQIVDTQSGPAHSFVWSYTPQISPEPRTILLRLVARDAALQTAETPNFQVLVAPELEASLALSDSAVLAGSPVTATLDVTGTAPFTGTLRVDNIPHETQVGSPPFTFIYATAPSPTTQVVLLSASVLDSSVPQSLTVSAQPLTAVGTSAPPFVVLTAPLPGIEVLEGAAVTFSAVVVGGVGGVPTVRFLANDEQVGEDATAGDGFTFVWDSDADVGEPPPPLTLEVVPVDLSAEAEDTLGQTGQSPPVGITVVRVPQIPALGGAALVALAVLLGSVAAHAALRRRPGRATSRFRSPPGRSRPCRRARSSRAGSSPGTAGGGPRHL